MKGDTHLLRPRDQGAWCGMRRTRVGPDFRRSPGEVTCRACLENAHRRWPLDILAERLAEISDSSR